MKSSKRFKGNLRIWSAFFFALLGAGVAVLKFGPDQVLTSKIRWIGVGDISHALLGWVFFRQDSWHFPWGLISTFYYPIGVSVGNMDSIPWLAVFFKTLSFALPSDFQYFGLWLLACYALQGYFAYLVLSLIAQDEWVRRLGSALVLLSAPLFYRWGHIALSAHWIVLACFWLGIAWAQKKIPFGRFATGTTALIAFSSGVHPYFTFMTLAFLAAVALSAILRDRRQARVWILLLLLNLGVCLLLLWGFGYFWFKNTTAEGFGYYGADVLALFNALDHSSLFLRSLRATQGQYEGMAYLGLGGMIVFVLACVALRRGILVLPTRRTAPLFWLWIWTLALTVYALGSKVRFGGNTLLNLSWFYGLLEPIPSSFRSSGRMIWVLFYGILFFGIAGVGRLLGVHRARKVLALCLLLQALDLVPLYWKSQRHSGVDPVLGASPLDAAPAFVWEGARRLEIFPPYFIQALQECHSRPDFTEERFNALAWQAARRGLAISGGPVSRGATEPQRQYCIGLAGALKTRRFAAGSVYLVDRKMQAELGWSETPAACRVLAEYWVCRQ